MSSWPITVGFEWHWFEPLSRCLWFLLFLQRPRHEDRQYVRRQEHQRKHDENEIHVEREPDVASVWQGPGEDASSNCGSQCSEVKQMSSTTFPKINFPNAPNYLSANSTTPF